MDRQPALTAAVAQGAALTCDQAVFTSIPSPMGRGYRLVAASAGVTADEKRELVQRCPSHNNLCDAAPAASGLAVFPMPAGRICILAAWHCELEHSGRGGHRVHTHALLLRPADYQLAGCDPLALEAACRAAVSDAIPPANQLLPTLTLDLSPTGPGFAAGQCAAGVVPRALDMAARAADAIFNQRRLLIANAPQPRALIHLLRCFLPKPVLARLTCSVGMKFSPVRDFELVFADVRREEVERIVDEYHYEVLDWSTTAQSNSSPRNAGPLNAWLTFVTRTLAAGGQRDLMQGVASIQDPDWQKSIDQILKLEADIERAATADEKLLEEIAAAHRPFVRKNDLQTNLHLKLLSATAQRKAELAAAAEAVQAAETSAAPLPA